MAAFGTPLLPASAFAVAADGAITFFGADDPVELARRRDRVAKKRARDADRTWREADARGWSSAIVERSLALRRRRGSASISPRHRCGWVVGAACRRRRRRGRAGLPSSRSHRASYSIRFRTSSSIAGWLSASLLITEDGEQGCSDWKRRYRSEEAASSGVGERVPF
ncbi:hypothetical protein EJB05_05859, partial [Eragrostis curvula]